MAGALTLDFFHDVVCAWCFNASSRLRILAAELDVEIVHHTYVLQASASEMAARWGSPAQARETILGHWNACRLASDRPELIDIEAMRSADFDYPHGQVAALACKAAEALGGQAAHWDMFDRLQTAHLTQARNVADPEVVADAAKDIGLDATVFRRCMDDPANARAVDADRQLARALGIRTIPAMIVRETGTRLVNGPLEDLRAQLNAAAQLKPAP